MLGGGSDIIEGHFHLACQLGGFAHHVHQGGDEVGIGEAFQLQGKLAELRVVPGKPTIVPVQVQASIFQVGQGETLGHGLAHIGQDQGVDAATSAAGRQADEAASGFRREIDREVGHHQDAKRLRHLPGLPVVFLQRLVAIAQVFLQDVFHVRGQVGEALVDVGGFGPDAAGDELLLVVGQVHEGGEILAAADRVHDGEAHFARRQPGQEAHHQGLDAGDGLAATLVVGLEEHRCLMGKRQQGGKGQLPQL